MGKWVNLSNKEISYLSKAMMFLFKTKEYKSIEKKLENLNKKISVSSAKAKGRNLQYWVCEKISKLLGIPFNQQDDDCLIHSREMGQAGADIILRGEAGKKFPFSIECKSSESLNLVGTIEQVKSNTKPNQDWIIVHKKKAIPNPIVIMDWDCFERLFKNE